jgi:hypothetical protein
MLRDMRQRGWAAVAVFGALSIGTWVRAGTTPREREASSNLTFALIAERSYFSEFDVYVDDATKVGFVPERGNRYRYVFNLSGKGGVLADTAKWPATSNQTLLAGVPPALLREAGLHGACAPGADSQEPCSVTVFAVGNLDGDPTLDLWSISTAQRTIDGKVVPPGQPFRHVNDDEK